MAQNLLELGKQFVADQEWSAELVMTLGLHLLKAAVSETSFDKKELALLKKDICQIILKMLDDAEKAEIKRLAESTQKESSKVPWEECKKVVEILFENPVSLSCCFPILQILSGYFSSSAAPAVAAEAKAAVAAEAKPAEAKAAPPPQESSSRQPIEQSPPVESETQVKLQVPQ